MKSFKILGMLVLFILALSLSASAQNVTVNPGAGSYPDLTSAFNAINAGTHTGAVTVTIVNSTTEPAGTSAVLNSSGAGSASYTSISIRPSSDGLTISGTPVTGRGVIELNGADNVTIDGDNPGSAGTNRNLTITNAAANTVAFSSVIRIALAATIVTSADNDTIRNLNLVGNATGRNTSGTASTTGSENTAYGVLATGGASTVAATTAPSAITSVSTTIGTGATANNLTVDNNSIVTVARGVSVQGAATTVFPGMVISNNTIGNPTAGAADQVYSNGISAQGSANGSIAGNTVYVEGYIPTSSSSANTGISLGGISANGTFTVERNKVNRVQDNTASGFQAYGINAVAGNGQIIRNNFVSGVINFPNGTFSTTFGAFGIRIGAGLNHQVYHNSVNMYGNLSTVGAGTGTGAALTAAFGITATTLTGCDVRNNIFVNTQTAPSAATPASSAFVAVFLPSAGTSAMNLTLNNNDYYIGAAPAVNNGYGQAGVTAGTNFFTTFDATMTTPATNLRSYTNTLSSAGTNDNASKAVDPQFTGAPTDLHIAVGSPLVDMGAAVGVTNDIDSQLRVGTPDIGADEPSGVTPPANDISATAIIVPATGSTFPLNATSTPQASFTNVGTATQTNVSVRFTITGPGGYVYTNTQVIPSIAPNQTITVTFAVPSAFASAGTYNTSAQVITPDANNANDTIMGSFNVVAPISGTVSVGTGGTFTSLTNAGGVFDALNAAGASSNVVINITSDLTGENGTVALNELAGGFTVLIKPSGAARSITGSSTVGIIRLNGADGVTIDGSLTGATASGVGGTPAIRNLTVTNTNTAATAGAVIIIQQGANSANNDTIKNVNVSGQDPTQTLVGIDVGGNTVGASPTVANTNIVIDNCTVQKAILGIFNNGVSAAVPGTGMVISRNDLSATGANRLRRAGIFFFSQNGIQVTENKIGGIVADEAADAIGIIVGIQNVTTTATTSGGVYNANISRNRIDGITSTNTIGFSAAGIAVGGDPLGANTISNNMISNVSAPSTSPDLTAGIFVAGVTGSNTKVYFNTVSLTGGRGAVASQIGSYGIAISGATIPTVDIKDNIFYNTQTSGGGANAKSYSIGTQSTTFTNMTSNYNDFFVSGANAGFFRSGSIDTAGTDYATLAAWQTATGGDANSKEVDPLFIDPVADPHLTPASPLTNMGISIAGINNDFDNDLRDSTPDIGADEVVMGFNGAVPAGTYRDGVLNPGATLGGPVTITGTLTLNGGGGTIYNGNGNTLTVACGASIAGSGTFVYFTNVVIRKDFCAPGSFTYPVGGNYAPISPQGLNPWTPVTANVTALGINPSSLSVSTTDSFLAGVDAPNSVSRYWTLTETGDLTADLSFTYGDLDVNGNEALYKVLKRELGVTKASPSSTNNPATNTATITGVTNFSDWSVGRIAAVAATVNVGGRVVTADGVSGVSRAKVTISGGNLPQSREITTNPFGYFNFDNLQVGQTYVLTVGAKQYTFTNPSIVITPEDDIANAIFVADAPQ
jgi:hypothetical protein